MPAQTGCAFNRLLTHDGTSGRPITVDQSVVFDWIDRKVGTGRERDDDPVPVPLRELLGERRVLVERRVLERVGSTRSGVRGRLHRHAGDLSDRSAERRPSTGRANVSPSEYVVQGVAETRFRLPGRCSEEDRGAALIKAETMAGRLARLRPVSRRLDDPESNGHDQGLHTPGQAEPDRRYLTISVRAPQDVPRRPFRFSSNASDLARPDERRGNEQADLGLRPAEWIWRRPVDAPHYSPIYGDPRSEQSFVSYARSGGVLLTGIALADEVGRC